jgi:MFS family permease
MTDDYHRIPDNNEFEIDTANADEMMQSTNSSSPAAANATAATADSPDDSSSSDATSTTQTLETTMTSATLFPSMNLNISHTEPQIIPQQDESMALLHEHELIHDTAITTESPSQYSPKYILHNFILLSVLFSANHGAVVACLSLATARLGDLGSYQSSVLYLSYTLSALIGATAVVKSIGARNSIQVGMWIYCTYVACFVVATLFPRIKEISALVGAFIGGIGGGFLWTAQGSYFSRASEEYALAKGLSIESATSLLGGIFAGIYLGEEVLLRLLSSFMIYSGWSWVAVFIGYTMIAIVAALLMVFTEDYPITEEERQKYASQSTFYKSTVTLRLFVSDPKMKYMAPLCAAFALTSVFIGTFVNAEVVKIALGDTDSEYVGLLTSIASFVGGIMSVVFGFAASRIGNASILVIGCMAFFLIALSFLLGPNLSHWNLSSLIMIYGLQGVGRATFEGALKAEYANVFEDKEAAFGNIIFQNGLVTTIGFIVAAHASCAEESNYCIKFEDGRLHNTLILELMIIGSTIFAVAGYHRAKFLYKEERAQHELESRLLGNDHLL